MRSHMIQTIAAIIGALALSSLALGQAVTRTPLPPSHPLLGTWRLDVPNTGCHEIYRIKPDGTTYVTSGAEIAESEFQIDVKPSAKGFYKWVDKLVKDNGKPDCFGSVSETGHVATNFLILLPDGKGMLICEKEDINTCVGPLVRVGSET